MTRDGYHSGHAGHDGRNLMPAATFDTLAAARDLETTGIERMQAEAIVVAIGRAGEEVATKRDLDPLATKAFVLQVGIGIVLANAALLVGITASLVKLF